MTKHFPGWAVHGEARHGMAGMARREVVGPGRTGQGKAGWVWCV